MKKIEWLVYEANGKLIDNSPTREGARETKKYWQDQIFEPWGDDVEHPLSIVKREWRLVEEKKAR